MNGTGVRVESAVFEEASDVTSVDDSVERFESDVSVAERDAVVVDKEDEDADVVDRVASTMVGLIVVTVLVVVVIIAVTVVVICSCAIVVVVVGSLSPSVVAACIKTGSCVWRPFNQVG